MIDAYNIIKWKCVLSLSSITPEVKIGCWNYYLPNAVWPTLTSLACFTYQPIFFYYYKIYNYILRCYMRKRESFWYYYKTSHVKFLSCLSYVALNFIRDLRTFGFGILSLLFILTTITNQNQTFHSNKLFNWIILNVSVVPMYSLFGTAANSILQIRILIYNLTSLMIHVYVTTPECAHLSELRMDGVSKLINRGNNEQNKFKCF